MSYFLDPKNDFAFKHLFGEEKHKDILLAFLNDILVSVQNPIADLTLLPIHQDPGIALLRRSILDVLCRDTEGKQYIVEMQCSSVHPSLDVPVIISARPTASRILRRTTAG
ncbi:MAG: Rpn family recombination-promoting nuclease/putative transposase [Puniceicoccales bacterium]|nr:Rpn family recombination-promoting nuclease/putative transposase [Puniceicoccales bacterium]